MHLVWAYAGFTAFVLAMLALDLGVFHRKAHEIGMREALTWSAVWIALALVFNVIVWWQRGSEDAMAFLAGYLVEKSLSVDNLFVFLVVFSYFKVSGEHQHKVLFWGVIGALVMRAVMIAVGAALLRHFHFVIYVFGGLLVVTGLKLAIQKDAGYHPGNNPVVKLFRRFFRVTDAYDGSRFLVKRDGRIWATPLMLVLVTVEFTDLVFALDSIPAIFAITTDTFIVYTSNIFAIMGLRSLYFALARLLGFFRYLKYGLSAVLAFVGIKMILTDHYKIPTGVSLGVIAGILALSMLVSWLRPAPPPVPSSLPPPPVKEEP